MSKQKKKREAVQRPPHADDRTKPLDKNGA